jgi:hypothetical protein
MKRTSTFILDLENLADNDKRHFDCGAKRSSAERSGAQLGDFAQMEHIKGTLDKN